MRYWCYSVVPTTRLGTGGHGCGRRVVCATGVTQSCGMPTTRLGTGGHGCDGRVMCATGVTQSGRRHASVQRVTGAAESSLRYWCYSPTTRLGKGGHGYGAAVHLC